MEEAITKTEARCARLRESHLGALTDLVDQIQREHPCRFVPYFDPCDGGTNAEILLMMQSPGPKALLTGFVSLDNPDFSAESLCAVFGLKRKRIVIWNTVPWFVGGSADRGEIEAHLERFGADIERYIRDLLRLLMKLQTVVLVGAVARDRVRAWVPVGIRIEEVCHPTITNYNCRRGDWDRMQAVLREL